MEQTKKKIKNKVNITNICHSEWQLSGHFNSRNWDKKISLFNWKVFVISLL